LSGPTADFPVDVPAGFLQVFYGVAFQISTPDVFDGIPETEAHVLGDLYALNS
jgi:hypothetical protein